MSAEITRGVAVSRSFAISLTIQTELHQSCRGAPWLDPPTPHTCRLHAHFEARGATEQEVLDKAAEHGRTAHGIQELSPELVAKVRAAIREEPEGQAVGA
jgi:predicted small metal-binding protein